MDQNKATYETAIVTTIVLRQPCPNKVEIREMVMESLKLGFGAYSNFNEDDVRIEFRVVKKKK